jgi:hypothetical protein
MAYFKTRLSVAITQRLLSGSVVNNGQEVTLN